MEHSAPTQHQIESWFNTLFQRDYAVYAPDTRRLYENAKRDQWNATSDVDWSTPVDPDAGVFADGLIDGYGASSGIGSTCRRAGGLTLSSLPGACRRSSTARKARSPELLLPDPLSVSPRTSSINRLQR